MTQWHWHGAPTVLTGGLSPVGQDPSSLMRLEMDIFASEWAAFVTEWQAIDPFIAATYARNASAYLWALSQSKYAFGIQDFGGRMPTAGSFGWRPFLPQDFGLPSWSQPVPPGGGTVRLFNHTSPAPLGAGAIVAFHGFVANPATSRVLALRLTVNNRSYPTWAYTGFPSARLAEHNGRRIESEPSQLFPLAIDENPDGSIVYPGYCGRFMLDATLDAAPPPPGEPAAEHLMPLGIIIAQYNYLQTLPAVSPGGLPTWPSATLPQAPLQVPARRVRRFALPPRDTPP